MDFNIVSLAVVMAALTGAFGIVDNFRFITSSVHDSWKQMEPSSVNLIDSGTGNTESFGFVYGGDKLWLVSRRYVGKMASAHRIHTDHIRYASSHGGVISTYYIARNSTWDHRSFKAVDQTSSGDVLFAAGGRLLMLTFDTIKYLSRSDANMMRIEYRKLFVWDDAKYDWSEIGLRVDPQSVTTSEHIATTDNILLRVNSVDPDGNTVYMVSSVGGSPGITFTINLVESITSKLDIQFVGSNNKPTNASIKRIVRNTQVMGRTMQPNTVFPAPVGDLFRLFQAYNYDEWFTFTGTMYTYDSKKTDGIPNTVVRGSVLAVEDQREADDRIFQGGNNFYMLRKQHTNAASKRLTRMVTFVDLETLKSVNPVEVAFPEMYPTKFSYRPDQRLLYAASLDRGIYVANLSEWFSEG